MERKLVKAKVKEIKKTEIYGVTSLMKKCVGSEITGYFEKEDIFRQYDALGYRYAWHPDDLEFKWKSFKERIK